MDFTKFWTICSANGIVIDLIANEQLQRYATELAYWNEKVNMISRKDTENIWERHILHSLSIMKYYDFKPKLKCIDIGTGGGLPGIPLKIVNPDISMTLLDSIRKKVNICNMFAQHTGLNNIKSICNRAEDLASDKEHAGKYDIVVSRAVALLYKLCDWSQPLLKKGGKMILLKGGDLSSEIHQAKDYFRNLEVKEIQIKLLGTDWFENEEKKLLICSFS